MRKGCFKASSIFRSANVCSTSEKIDVTIRRMLCLEIIFHQRNCEHSIIKGGQIEREDAGILHLDGPKMFFSCLTVPQIKPYIRNSNKRKRMLILIDLDFLALCLAAYGGHGGLKR